MFKQTMKSKLYAIVIILFLTTNSFSEIIKKIDIKGNERVNSETIKIFGSPGTGKTTTLLNILEEKIAEGYQPNKIGFFSFTRRALKEARRRVIHKFNLSDDDLDYFRTIHSLCYRTLSINSGQVFKGERVKEFSELVRVEMSSVSEEDTSGLSVKFSDPKARASYVARHNCDTANDKTTPGYWSCRLPRYAKQLGLSGGGSFFW